jgi:hypothetical protein
VQLQPPEEHGLLHCHVTKGGKYPAAASAIGVTSLWAQNNKKKHDKDS